jgi:hypothetical protein
MVKPDTAAKKDSPKTEVVKPPVQKLETVSTPPPPVKKDSIVAKPLVTAFTYKPEDKHYAVVLLNRVDLVWVNETKNAFSVYNRSKFYNRQFEYTVVNLNTEYRLLLIGMFDNAQAATGYVSAVKPVSSTAIMPWLKADKYSFSIISADNLNILKTQQDVNLYRQFVEKNLPGKF